MTLEILINWTVFFLVNGLLLYAAYCLSCYLNQRAELFSLVVVGTGIIYFALITVNVLLLGVVIRYLNVFSVAALSVLVAALLIYFFRKFHYPFRPAMRQAYQEIFSRKDRVLTVVLALFALQAVILIAKVVWLPPHVWDVFSYHLTPAVEWYQQGLIPAQIDSPVQRINSQTLGMTVLSYWYFIFLRDDMLVELPQLLWALLLVPTVYAVLRQSDVEPRWSLKFAILIFFIPIVLMQAVTAKDHLGLNVGFIAALLFMASFLKTGRFNQLILAAIAFGLVLGYKLSGALYPMAAGAVLIPMIWTCNKRLFTDTNRRLVLLKTAGASIVVMSVIGGYWYLRNLVLYGKLQGTIGSHHIADLGLVESVTTRFGLARFYNNLEQFFPRVFDYQSIYGADLPGISGFGPQFVAFGLIAVLAAVASIGMRNQRKHIINLYALSALVLLLVYFLFYFTSNNYRLFSFFAIIMIMYGAFICWRSGSCGARYSAGIINSVIVVSIIWCLVNILPPQYTNLKRFREFVSLDAAYRTSANFTRWFIVHRPSFYRQLYAIPATQPIAVVTGRVMNFPGEVYDDVWSYTYYDRHWQRRLVYLDQADYLYCADNHVCKTKASLGQVLADKGIALVSVCKSNYCLTIDDPDFAELAPGFYYYMDKV